MTTSAYTAAVSKFPPRPRTLSTALALTSVAKAAGDAVTATLPSVFDRPTPFTLRAVTTTAAKKNNLVATVNIRPVQAQYLAIQETGGTETPQDGKQAFVVPVGAALNSYGNLPKGYLARLKGRKKNQAFVGVEHGVGGFWLRKAGKLVLLAAFGAKRTYKAKFGYHETVAKSVAATLPKAMADAIAKAVATAKS